MNRKTFDDSMIALIEYYNKQVSNASFFDIYWRKVKNLTDEQFNDAVDNCIDECTFFPKVSEILERVKVDTPPSQKGSVRWCENTQRLIENYYSKWSVAA